MKQHRLEHIVTAAGFVLAVMCSLLFSACDESLPPRNDPANVLVPACAVEYFVSRIDEAIYITVKVQNNYTEVLSDASTIYGSITISYVKDPEFNKHITLSAADFKSSYFDPKTGQTVFSKATYSPSNKTLTIPVGQFAVFQYRWDLFSDSLVDLRKQVGFAPDPTTTGVLISAPVPLQVNTSVHLYKKVPMFYTGPTVTIIRFKKNTG